jgi:hypothetical protein
MKKLTVILALMALMITSAALARGNDGPAGGPGYGMDDKGPGEWDRDHKPRRFNFEDCDKNSNGGLELGEYLDCFPKADKKRFDNIDRNNDGKVSKDELRAWREAHREKMLKERKARRAQAFKRCDKNDDGVLSMDEYINCPQRSKHDRKDGKFHDGRRGPDGRDRRE